MRNWLSFWWRYARGKMPWDTRVVPPEVVALAESLPPGRALDLGCGTGTSTLYLASRGWQATGVDFVALPIREAKRRARHERSSAQFFRADVTRLDFLAQPYDLVLDIGCFHSLTADGQERYAAHVARLTRSGAVCALYAFAPRELNGRRVGITPADVARLFTPAFTIASIVHGQDKGSGPASAWYTLRRT